MFCICRLKVTYYCETRGCGNQWSTKVGFIDPKTLKPPPGVYHYCLDCDYAGTFKTF